MKTTTLFAAAALTALSNTSAIAHDWTGFYSGYMASRANHSSHTWHDRRVQGGFQAGYNYDLGGVVLGGEAEVKMLNASVGGLSINDSIAAKYRIGFDLDGLLVYGTLGLVRSSFDLGGVSANQEGTVYGFGLTQRLSKHWSYGLELLHSEYRRPLGFSSLYDTSASVKLNFHF